MDPDIFTRLEDAVSTRAHELNQIEENLDSQIRYCDMQIELYSAFLKNKPAYEKEVLARANAVILKTTPGTTEYRGALNMLIATSEVMHNYKKELDRFMKQKEDLMEVKNQFRHNQGLCTNLVEDEPEITIEVTEPESKIEATET